MRRDLIESDAWFFDHAPRECIFTGESVSDKYIGVIVGRKCSFWEKKKKDIKWPGSIKFKHGIKTLGIKRD